MLFIVDSYGNKGKVGDVVQFETKREEVVSEYWSFVTISETCLVTVRNLDIRVLEIMMATGLIHNNAGERLYGIFPGGLKTARLGFIVEYTDGKDQGKVYLGTEFRCVSGIPWPELVSGECSQIELEFEKTVEIFDWNRAKQLKEFQPTL